MYPFPPCGQYLHVKFDILSRMGNKGNKSGEIGKGRGKFEYKRVKCRKMEKNLSVNCGESFHSDILPEA